MHASGSDQRASFTAASCFTIQIITRMKHPVAMPQVLWFFLTPALVIISHLVVPPPVAVAVSGMAPSAAATVSDVAPSAVPAPRRPGCPDKCGDVDIPYPFGIGDDCAWQDLGDFTITCNHSFSPPRPYKGDFEIINITVEAGEMRVFSPVSYICYNSSNTTEPGGDADWSLSSTDTPFLISPTRNVFTGVGCSTVAFLEGREDGSYFTGCITTCESLEEAAQDGDECTGLGCCQTHIPGNLSVIHVYWSKGNDTHVNTAWEYSPCSYAFVSEKGWYHFRREDLSRDGNKSFLSRVGERTIPLVFDWAIRKNGSCLLPPEASGGKPTASACVSEHSLCVNATQGDGYLCNCSQGYTGNPYRIRGCTTVFCVIVLLVILAYFGPKKLKRRKQRMCFDKNGGQILKGAEINIFTQEQLKNITNHYTTPIGEGNFGKVFMGKIDGDQQVAVKCSSPKGKELPREEFVKEITIQFRIRHANLARLIGCCLETDVPMLVFEYFPNGSLYRLLHVTRHQVLPLPARLNIAIGSAEALAYMHSAGGQNHVHGDIKSDNILIDNNLMPKVSDFGSSKLMSIDRCAWEVKADRSYMDPMYMKTDRFTEKSDVYSFGVVLLELITGKKAKYDGNNSLPIDFVKSCKEEGNGRKMYDRDILAEGDAQSQAYMECLDRIGELAVRCLKEDDDERPTMAEVVEELKQVKFEAWGGPCSEAR
ncbi:wall-associated receptor kinase 5-like isoform X2 [Phragmites australis]|uniref:wall-associated receptor kinase 5-like isoform X2 n=1 Tax=Phragmites australis TaxID=29695 RepID=UPI002D79A3B7|nr:wall-associated receptor kinase 5-like isoform X2 [Phragmites australis]